MATFKPEEMAAIEQGGNAVRQNTHVLFRTVCVHARACLRACVHGHCRGYGVPKSGPCYPHSTVESMPNVHSIIFEGSNFVGVICLATSCPATEVQ